MTMQTANVLLALSGNRGETVPKYAVTPAEVAVLQRIHGEDAVYDIDVLPLEAERTHRQEIARLTVAYGRQDGERRVSPAVAELFPGAAARVFETFDELELPDELYLRKQPVAAKAISPLDHDGNGVKGGSLKNEHKEELGLRGMTLNELRAYADKAGVDLHGITKKADVIEALELHQSKIEAEGVDTGASDEGDDGDEPDEPTGDIMS